MSKIHILPEHLANQIAAGEVIERPASVVKELLENSLDAGADRIDIEIEGGGTRLIRIIDNGEGMDEDDVLLSLERHGTSKIQNEEDLTEINSLGFRGEAIPSIGSVSKMVITSRRFDRDLGTQATINYGKLLKVHEAGCSVGTKVEISNLFGNTPARKKFLRTTRTELGHIDEVVKNYAYARPEITFSLTINGKRTLYFDSNLSLEQRFAKTVRYEGSFIKVNKVSLNRDSSVSGFLIPPEHLLNGPSRMRFFVNGRAVKDRMMSHAVLEGLRGFLMKGKHPAGLIHLSIPPSEVDVNVHPAKHEVRFRNSRDIHYLLADAVRSAMAEQQQTLHHQIFAQPKERESIPEKDHGETDKLYTELPAASLSDLSNKENTQKPIPTTIYTSEPPLQFKSKKTVEKSWDQRLPKPPSMKVREPAGHGLQIIGQFEDLYIFCKNSEGLVVIDQHAAHERLLFEKLRKQFENRSVSSQQLLFPETVELTLFQSQLVEKHEEELHHMGFNLREFGGSSYVISAVPALMGKVQPGELLINVLEQFGSERSDAGEDIIDKILSTMACRAAVKGGTSLSPQEIEALLNDMEEADLFSHCPHGRPVLKQFSIQDIHKWFHRT